MSSYVEEQCFEGKYLSEHSVMEIINKYIDLVSNGAKVARWYSEDDDECRCSTCNYPVHIHYNHLGEMLLPVRCPNCGAFIA